MSTMSAQDYRRAGESELLQGIRAHQPLALAEAYHRIVPAAHAVARRLVTEASEVEDVLLDVFTQLWETPPDQTPLEGWGRRATWAACAERLRADGRAPASPSASVLLPDLPAPEVRFLDAAERAISDLADEERRALLLAHDKGVPTSAQDPGADVALVRALISLAGPENSAGDRAALDDDPCNELTGLGDWCLGLGDDAEMAAVEEAVDERTGCAARSRAVRRGRRRIEGLPATPDMGHRVLVSVLTGAAAADSTSPAAAGGITVDDPAPADTTASAAPGDDATGEILAVSDTPAATAPDLGEPEAAAIVHPDGTSDLGPGQSPIDTAAAAGAMAMADDEQPTDPSGLAAVGDPAGDAEDEDPFASLESAGADADPFAAPADDDDPFAALQDDAGADPTPAELATADMPQAGVPVEGQVPSTVDDEAPFGTPDGMDWAPNPADTAELRLSDILAEDDDDDPFAALDGPAPAEDPAPAAGQTSPYAALSSLDEAPQPAADLPFSAAQGTGQPGAADAGIPDTGTPVVAGSGPRGDAHEVYVEGQDVPLPEPSRGGGFAAVLAWILPVLGGLAVGVLVAMQVFG